MNLTQKLEQAQDKAFVAHSEAIEIAEELLAELAEIGQVYKCYKLRCQIDWHVAAIAAMKHGEFGA